MSKRFSTYFGIPIPPFKEEKLQAGSFTIRFVITGRIPSKKNNSMAVTIRKDARSYAKKLSEKGFLTPDEVQRVISKTHAKIRGNKEYQQWIIEQKPIIQEQMHVWVDRLGPKGLIFPLQKCTISARFYHNNNYSIDTLNKCQSVQDLLVDCKVIQDDNYSVLNPIHYASANYKDELIYSICFISLSFKMA
jgi:hypothetical protein